MPCRQQHVGKCSAEGWGVLVDLPRELYAQGELRRWPGAVCWGCVYSVGNGKAEMVTDRSLQWEPSSAEPRLGWTQRACREKKILLHVRFGRDGEGLFPSAMFSAPSNEQQTRVCHRLLFEIVFSLSAKESHEKHLTPKRSCKFNINSATE